MLKRERKNKKGILLMRNPQKRERLVDLVIIIEIKIIQKNKMPITEIIMIKKTNT